MIKCELWSPCWSNVPEIIQCISSYLATFHLSQGIVQSDFPTCIFCLWLNEFINCFSDYPYILLKDMGLMSKYIVYNLPLSFVYSELLKLQIAWGFQWNHVFPNTGRCVFCIDTEFWNGGKIFPIFFNLSHALHFFYLSPLWHFAKTKFHLLNFFVVITDIYMVTWCSLVKFLINLLLVKTV